MLEHFQAGNNIKLFWMNFRKLFRCAVQVGYVQLALKQMQFRDRQRSFSLIDRGDCCAMMGQCLGQNASAAANVQDPLLHQIDVLAYLIDPERVDIMQRFEFAVWIPPARSESLKLADFKIVNIFH